MHLMCVLFVALSRRSAYQIFPEQHLGRKETGTEKERKTTHTSAVISATYLTTEMPSLSFFFFFFV